MTSKIAYIDVETGGVDPEKDALLQVSGCIEIEGIVVEPFNYFIRPFTNDRVSEEAMKVTGITYEMIESDQFMPPTTGYAVLHTLFNRYVDKYNKKDKMHFVGYNANFDHDFIRSFFVKNKDNYYGSFFSYPCIDVMTLWAYRLMDVRHHLSDFKLMTVAKHVFGEIDESRLHDAEYDIELTRRLFKALEESLRTMRPI